MYAAMRSVNLLSKFQALELQGGFQQIVGEHFPAVQVPRYLFHVHPPNSKKSAFRFESFDQSETCDEVSRAIPIRFARDLAKDQERLAILHASYQRLV